MPPIVWIDGTFHDRAPAKVSVFDHGLLYGDGVFEGIRVYNRRVFRLGQHLDRLFASAKGVWLDVPLAKPALHRLVEEAVGKSGLDEAYIRLLVTRGVGDLGLDPRKCPKPSVICIVDTIPPAYAGILDVVTRDAVIELAREATYGVEEIPLNRYDLYTADEMFLTGTAAEVVSVTKLDGRVIGHGQPGPVTKELAKRFKALAIRGD